MNSTDLRATLRDLEAACERTGEAVIKAEADHRAAVARGVLHNDHAAAERTATALDTARRDHARTVETRDEARRLLAEAVRAERHAKRDAARAEIEAELAEMAESARGLDTQFAAFAGQILRLHERETELHRKTRDNFGSPPWAAPQLRSAARSLATFLGTLANGGSPDAKPFITATVESGAFNIRQVLHDAD